MEETGHQNVYLFKIKQKNEKNERTNEKKLCRKNRAAENPLTVLYTERVRASTYTDCSINRQIPTAENNFTSF